MGISGIGLGHFPENDAHLYDSLSLRTRYYFEADFNDAIDAVEDFYRPLHADAFGARLRINRYWSNSTVNAVVQHIRGNTWTVNMYGGPRGGRRKLPKMVSPWFSVMKLVNMSAAILTTLASGRQRKDKQIISPLSAVPVSYGEMR